VVFLFEKPQCQLVPKVCYIFYIFLVPPKKPMVHDSNGRKMVEKLGPFKVGDDLSATCITVGGKIRY